MKKQKITLLLSGIFLLALLLRFYRLNLNLPPLYADETGGYYWIQSMVNAPTNNILKYLYQKLFFTTFSFTWLFGPTPLGARAASAFYGSLTTVALFFFAKSIYLKKNQPNKIARVIIIALLTALLTSLSPWNFIISRLGAPHIPIIIILVCLHLGLFLKAKTTKAYLLSSLPLLASLLYYPSLVIISPFALGLVYYQAFLASSKKQQKIIISTAAISLILIGAIFIFRFKGLSLSGRGLDLAIWRDVNVTADSNLYRGLARLSAPTIFSFNQDPENLASKLTYNYPLSVINIFTRNYFSFFSPEFLFLKGDPILRHSTGQVGALLPFLAPFMLYGAFIFFKSANKKQKQLFLIWLVISPVPAAITKDGTGYLLRAITIMPLLSYFSALGIISSFKLIRHRFLKNIYLLALALVALYSTYYFLYGYFHVYPALAARSYEYGFKELADFQQSRDNQTMLVIWNGFYPHSYFRFWQQTSVKEYLAFEYQKITLNQSTFYQTYPNLYFAWPQDVSDLNQFIKVYQPQYLVFPQDYLQNNPQYVKIVSQPVQVINYPDQAKAFEIYRL